MFGSVGARLCARLGGWSLVEVLVMIFANHHKFLLFFSIRNL